MSNSAGGPSGHNTPKKSKPIDALGNESAKRPRQEAPLPTQVVHPEDLLDTSIAEAVFDEVEGRTDISQVPDFFYKKLAEKLFLMCGRKPEQHRECFEVTINKLRKPNVLVGNVWSV
ncbi:hypothetical protein CDV31_016098 [Fusarium ambrosium]|uniref:Uncharacterized protein n=1 Tax=Fusarium ambrosium TaxID=131363 RepID=A0A428SEI9_9HYPO|nr:hypothetical protein CDV31_016098 [Fusarium ambrosium]